jgi:hypothetical protein
MIDSLKDGIFGFQRAIAAVATLSVKKFSQPHQRQDADAGLVPILQSRTELFVDHPTRKDTVGAIG